MSDRPYLLDTNVLVALVRGKDLGDRIDATFGLRKAKIRPLVSIVTQGEIWVMAEINNWGTSRRSALDTALNNVVPVDINHPKVLEAYVEIEIFSRKHAGGARKMGKNDVWIAACAKAAGAYLLTTDHDFDHLLGGVVQGEWIDPVTK